MSRSVSVVDFAQSFDSFGPFLHFLRKRARLTQRDLGLAVGYSIAQISLLESGRRLPEPTTIAALFVPALELQDEPTLVARLLQLASVSHGAKQITITHTIRRKVTVREVKVTPPSNLLAPLTSFISRERELESLRAMVMTPTTRLITLLGPPGVGKTRLALELAWDVHKHRDFEDGVWFVDLAAIRDAGLVAAAIHRALGIKEPPRESDADALKKYLRAQDLFLIVDNFEQVLAAAPLVADLLAVAPTLKILITSREALDLYGEHEFRLSPLTVPDLARLPAVAELLQFPAVELFIERAQTVKPDFRLTPENALMVFSVNSYCLETGICKRNPFDRSKEVDRLQ